MIILGIDPGTAITGYGVIENIKGKLKAIDHGCILTDKKLKMPERLDLLGEELKKIIKKYKPQAMAVEELFFFKNAKTVITVGQARGVILFVGKNISKKQRLDIYEYTPLQVKQAVVGYGRADKKQVQQMVKAILGLNEIPKPDDAADALAIAICCASSMKFELRIKN
ncbi:MAG: crossover junction endodeoxyribonuclease RuvC [Candidatus Pacebacteria bacterium]|nr:crossover junction endodeoxyribonuclease RuvC [Candidatus Paceibacterota bacterium]